MALTCGIRESKISILTPPEETAVSCFSKKHKPIKLDHSEHRFNGLFNLDLQAMNSVHKDTTNDFKLESLASFGLSQAIDFVKGNSSMPEDFNIENQIDSLIEHLNSFEKSPYYSLGNSQGGIYMERDWLIPKTASYPAARVHRIHRSDLDRATHNHPWNHFSVILEHGYYELMPSPDGVEDLQVIPTRLACQVNSVEPLFAVERKRGDVIFRTPKMRHKLVILSESQKPLTLFVTAPKTDDWGFFTESGFVLHTDYFNQDVTEL